MARSVCVIDGCDLLVTGRGWCSKHYTRWARFGDPTHRVRGEARDGKRVCGGCDVDLPVEEFATYRYLCRPCGAAEAARRRKPWVSPTARAAQCVECGGDFQANAKKSKCCSPACAASRKRRLDRLAAATRDRSAANESTRRWYAQNKDRAFDAAAAYRARQLVATVETVSRRVVLDRDGWTCQLCQEAIDPAARAPHPMTASVDHIVPLARGGEHSYRNVQAAHLGCNTSKGARVVAGGVPNRG